MFNQNNYRKRTKKISKERLNWYQLAKAQKVQRRINQYQDSINCKQSMLNDNFDERLRALELASFTQKPSGILARFCSWFNR